jgi:hypothetical protein
MNGAFVGYTEIMEQVKQSFPDIKVLTKDDFDINLDKTKGTMVHLNTFKNIRNAMSLEDIIYEYKLKNGYKSELSTEIPESITVNVNDKFFHYVNKEQSNLPKMLIIGDSYIYSFLLPIIAESFSELYFINFTTTQEIMDLQNDINADFVLYEFVDRVFDDNIYTELEYFNKSDYDEYTNLPFIDDGTAFNIDTPIIKNPNIITIDPTLQEQIIGGWAVDIKGECLPRAIYLKVGDALYSPKLIARSDIAAENEEYLMSGFQFIIPTPKIIDAAYIEFFIVSGNGEYQYKPKLYNIEKK